MYAANASNDEDADIADAADATDTSDTADATDTYINTYTYDDTEADNDADDDDADDADADDADDADADADADADDPPPILLAMVMVTVLLLLLLLLAGCAATIYSLVPTTLSCIQLLSPLCAVHIYFCTSLGIVGELRPAKPLGPKEGLRFRLPQGLFTQWRASNLECAISSIT